MLNFDAAAFVKSAASPGDFLHDAPEIAFAGRSNVGKSSVINCLTRNGKLSRVSATPGKTAHVNYFALPDRETRRTGAYLVDLPGYGFAKVSAAEKRRWAGLMEAYFAENAALRLLVVILDARHGPKPDDLDMLAVARGRWPLLILANKADKLRPSERGAAADAIRACLGTAEFLLFSAETGEGRDSLRTALQTVV